MTPAEVVAKVDEVWKAGDRDGWMALAAPDIDLEGHRGSQFWGMLGDAVHEGFPDGQFTIRQTIQEGDDVAMRRGGTFVYRSTSRARNKGAFVHRRPPCRPGRTAVPSAVRGCRTAPRRGCRS